MDSLQTGGNSWSTGPAPPPPPGTPAIEHSRHKKNEKSILIAAAIAGIFLGSLAMIIIAIALFQRRSSSPSSHFLEEDRRSQKSFNTFASQELSKNFGADASKGYEEFSIDIKTLQKLPSLGVRSSVSESVKSFTGNELANHPNARSSTSILAIPFSLENVQTATGNFASSRFLGEGSIGCVYRAKYADGKVLAVKVIDPSLLHDDHPEEFSEMVSNISKVHHPNTAELVGYCSELGHNMLIYEYYRNGSLHEFLHLSDDYSKPLTWNTRVRIALGTARAVEYLHEICYPPLIHKNIKSSNILLDEELNPHLSDYGLAFFHQSTSPNLGAGYNAPECTKSSALKGDVYSFGVVMLELFTGRKPLDSLRPEPEQRLVDWASPQLHDTNALEKMADPALRGLYPPKSLSQFADTIALCVQLEPELRPPISEVVQALLRVESST